MIIPGCVLLMLTNHVYTCNKSIFQSFVMSCFLFMINWVSAWLLFNANSAFFQQYNGEKKLIFNEMMMRPPLYKLSWIFIIVLAHWYNSPRVDMSPHSDILFWFQVNQSLLFLLNAACLTMIYKTLHRTLKIE